MPESVGDCQSVGVDAVHELVAHVGDGADALLRPFVDSPLMSQRRQQIVQPVSCKKSKSKGNTHRKRSNVDMCAPS